MKRASISHAARESVRREWETSPVSFWDLEERIGSGKNTLRQHALRNGWKRSPDVIAQAKAIKAERVRAYWLQQVADGVYVPPSKRPGASPIRPRKWPVPLSEQPSPRYVSVFAYAEGVAI